MAHLMTLKTNTSIARRAAPATGIGDIDGRKSKMLGSTAGIRRRWQRNRNRSGSKVFR
jgi:hypothetical protein